MSSHDLVNAYMDGRISRRTLIRRLLAAGVSIGAATSYAHLLAPERASAGFTGECDDLYPTVTMSIRTLNLADVVESQRLRVRIRPSEPMRLHLVATTRKSGKQVVIAERNVRFDAADGRLVRIDLQNLAPLQGRDRARVTVAASRISPGKDLCFPNVNEISVTAVLS